jgi:hypothetical protein
MRDGRFWRVFKEDPENKGQDEGAEASRATRVHRVSLTREILVFIKTNPMPWGNSYEA